MSIVHQKFNKDISSEPELTNKGVLCLPRWLVSLPHSGGEYVQQALTHCQGRIDSRAQQLGSSVKNTPFVGLLLACSQGHQKRLTEKIRGSRKNLIFRMADDPVEIMASGPNRSRREKSKWREADHGKEAREVSQLLEWE